MDSTSGSRARKADIGYGYDSVFPTKLRMLLSEPGMTQEKLATALGVKRQSVAQWKDGKTMPDIYYLKDIAKYFNVSYEYLLDDTPNKSRDNVAIGDLLGLTDESIGVLSDLNQREPRYAQILNRFCTKRFLWGAMHGMYTYWEVERDMENAGALGARIKANLNMHNNEIMPKSPEVLLMVVEHSIQKTFAEAVSDALANNPFLDRSDNNGNPQSE